MVGAGHGREKRTEMGMREGCRNGRRDRCFFFSSRRRHTRFDCDWSSDVCSSDLRRTCRSNLPWDCSLDPLSLKVVDPGYSPMAGLTVTFVVTLGGGSLSNPSGTTDAAGVTTIEWTLGPTAGAPQQVQASIVGASVAPVTFTATAIAGPPASVVKLSGDGQSAATNNPVAVPPEIGRASCRERV